jgi:hypothetical protein
MITLAETYPIILHPAGSLLLFVQTLYWKISQFAVVCFKAAGLLAFAYLGYLVDRL